MNITAPAIIALLPLVADQDWVVDQEGQIRNERGECPICALANEVIGSSEYVLAAESALLDITGYFFDDCTKWFTHEEELAIGRVMKAADEWGSAPLLRGKLLAALNLEV